MSDELLKGFAIITFWKRWAPGSLLPREGVLFTHTEAAALGAGLGCCGVAGALFLPRGFMTQTCGICGGFWVIFLCGNTVFPFNLFRGRDSLQPGIQLVDRHRSESLFGPREEVPRKGFPKMPVALGWGLRVRSACWHLGIASNLMVL